MQINVLMFVNQSFCEVKNNNNQTYLIRGHPREINKLAA